ncbi:phage antirepressor [Terribacillus saccharophilus]|uniref:phage antirepressor n=1 Tax=Terribacillus saccharophilus TaxID=361277 RepID=UPI003D2BCD4B
MLNLISKVFNHQQLRVIEQDNEPLFLLKDVCIILDLGQVAGVKRRLNDEVISNHPIKDDLGRTQTATFVNEDGLYDVVLDSRKTEAKRFRKWITSEVIPSIRKHGAYATPETVENLLGNPDFAIKLFTNIKQEQEKRRLAEYERDALYQEKQRNQPYTQFGQIVSHSSAAINIGVFSKIIYEKHGINMGRNRMFEWLRNKGYLFISGRERNSPKQQYIEQGLFKVRPTIVSRTHGDVEQTTTLITGKGQVKITHELLNELTERVKANG